MSDKQMADTTNSKDKNPVPDGPKPVEEKKKLPQLGALEDARGRLWIMLRARVQRRGESLTRHQGRPHSGMVKRYGVCSTIQRQGYVHGSLLVYILSQYLLFPLLSRANVTLRRPLDRSYSAADGLGCSPDGS